MVDDWESISPMGEYVRGMDELIRLVNITLMAFPDIQLHIVDTFCEGNDIDGYKTTMPVIHTATHLGYHPVFGSPTGKTATWYGVPNCFIALMDSGSKFSYIMIICIEKMCVGIPLRSICLIPCHCIARWVLHHQKKPGSCLQMIVTSSLTWILDISIKTWFLFK
jgi:hypothetical protein